MKLPGNPNQFPTWGASRLRVPLFRQKSKIGIQESQILNWTPCDAPVTGLLRLACAKSPMFTGLGTGVTGVTGFFLHREFRLNLTSGHDHPKMPAIFGRERSLTKLFSYEH